MKTEEAIRNRKTVKVLGDEFHPEGVNQQHSAAIREIVELAGWAPYHYACHKEHRQTGLTSIVPWRFYILEAAECRKLLEWLKREKIESGKIARMLAVADAMIKVTWLPDELENSKNLYDPTIRNTEHIAAASAAVQNFLLAATSKGLPNYWSSGGVLREKHLFDYLGISKTELLLGAVFLFPAETSAEKVPGKLRGLRGEPTDWSRWIKL